MAVVGTTGRNMEDLSLLVEVVGGLYEGVGGLYGLVAYS